MLNPRDFSFRWTALNAGYVIAALIALLMLWFAFAPNQLPTPESTAESRISSIEALTKAGYSLRWTADVQGKLNAEQLFPSLPDESAGSRWLPLEIDTALPVGLKSAAWLHLRVPQTKKSEQLYLEFERARILKIDSFLRSDEGLWSKQSAGFTVPFSARALPTQHPSFAIHAKPDAVVHYLFRVQHIAPLVLAPRLLDSSQFASSSRGYGLQDGAVLGALLSFSLACFMAVFAKRWSAFTWPAIIAVCIVFVFGPTLGLTARWLWPHNGQLDRTLTWAASTILVCVTMLMLVQLQFQTKILQKKAYQVLIAATVMLAVMIGLHFTFPMLISLAWHRGVSLLMSLLLIYMLSLHARASTPWLKWVRAGLILVVLISVPRWLRAMGWIENADWFELGASLVYMVQCFFLFFALLECVRLQQTDIAITRALSPIDEDTGLHNWRVCHEAISRVAQRSNNASQSCSIVLIQLNGLTTELPKSAPCTPKQLTTALAHRVRAIAEPLDGVGLRSERLIFWVIERSLTSAELTQLGHKIRLVHAHPYEQFDSATQQTLSMICCFNPPVDLSADQLIDQMITTAELASGGTQRTMQFMVFQ